MINFSIVSHLITIKSILMFKTLTNYYFSLKLINDNIIYFSICRLEYLGITLSIGKAINPM